VTLPASPTVRIRLGTGVSFGDGFVLGSTTQGILGTNELASSSIEYIDVSPQVQQIATRHGRDRVFNQYLPGEAIVQFLDFTGDWNPANTSSPYYPNVLPMRQIQVTADYQGTEYALHSGYITSWDYQWADPSVDYAVVTVQSVDAFRLLQLATITNVTGAANKDLPGERINLILDEIGWPASARDIDTGTTELLNDPGTTRTALAAIQLIADSDLGIFYISHEGKATYVSRVALSEKAAGIPWYFDDEGVNIQYQDVNVGFDEQELANQVSFTRIGGSTQTVSDATSISNYFLRSYEQSGLMMENNSDALARANQVLAYRKNPRLRIDSLVLDCSSDSDRVAVALQSEIGQPIVVEKNMAGGTDLSLRITIQGHSHDITPDRWTTTFTTAFPLGTAFILGSSEFGVLGSNTL